MCSTLYLGPSLAFQFTYPVSTFFHTPLDWCALEVLHKQSFYTKMYEIVTMHRWSYLCGQFKPFIYMLWPLQTHCNENESNDNQMTFSYDLTDPVLNKLFFSTQLSWIILHGFHNYLLTIERIVFPMFVFWLHSLHAIICFKQI